MKLREDYNELVGAAAVRAVSYLHLLECVFVGMFITIGKRAITYSASSQSGVQLAATLSHVYSYILGQPTN